MANLAGTVNLQVGFTDTLPVSSTRLTAYPVPCRPNDASVTYGNGTAAGLGTKFFQLSGSAAAAVVDTDLSAAVCSDGTTGFSHVREFLVYNDDAVNALTLGLGSNPFPIQFLGGTTPTVVIPPGSVFRLAKPLGAVGWVVDGTHKVVRVDPGVNTIAFRLIVVGD